MADPLVIAGATFSSRLIAGTARFPNQQVMLDALEASGAEMVTASIRRISLEGYSGSLIDLLGDKYRILPNTAGCVTARDAGENYQPCSCASRLRCRIPFPRMLEAASVCRRDRAEGPHPSR